MLEVATSMIECLLDNCKEVFYSPKNYKAHLKGIHSKNKDAKQILKRGLF